MKKKLSCSQCGSCFNTCPTFQHLKSEEYSPKAKQGLMATALDPQGKDSLKWQKMVDLAGHCTSCERCKNACPLQLSVPEVLAEVRSRHPKWQQYAWREWIKHNAFLWPPAQHMAPLMPRKMLPSKLSVLHASALAMQKPVPVTPWLRFEKTDEIPTPWAGKRVALFSGCTATRLRPQWIEKAKKILTILEAEIVENIPFQCCGGTYEHAGMLDAWHKANAYNVAQWEKAGRPVLITFCASCLHSLRQYTCDASAQEAWEKSLVPLSTVLNAATVSPTEHAPQSIDYHSPCHWGKRDLDLDMLQAHIPHIHKGKALCCGFGGVLKLLNPSLSENLATNCWQGFTPTEEGEKKHVLTGCSGCVMQLSAHAPKQASVHHWLDVLEV